MAHICWVERGFGIIVIQIHLVPHSIRSQECRVVSGVHQHHHAGRVRIKLICTPRILVSWSHLGMAQCSTQEQQNCSLACLWGKLKDSFSYSAGRCKKHLYSCTIASYLHFSQTQELQMLYFAKSQQKAAKTKHCTGDTEQNNSRTIILASGGSKTAALKRSTVSELRCAFLWCGTLREICLQARCQSGYYLYTFIKAHSLASNHFQVDVGLTHSHVPITAPHPPHVFTPELSSYTDDHARVSVKCERLPVHKADTIEVMSHSLPMPH